MSSKPKAKAIKEAFFVQITNPADDSVTFVNESGNLGRKSGYTNPKATCAMRVTPETVLFSAFKLHSKSRESFLARPLSIPAGPLEALERAAETITPPIEDDTTLVVDLADKRYTLTMERDDNDNVTLEMGPDQDEHVFELPRRMLQLRLAFRSPRNGRLVVASWLGYQNKPGNPETLTRAVAYALNHLAGLSAFALVAKIGRVQVPPPPGRFTVAHPVRSESDEVRFPVPVRLWDASTGTPQHVGGGTVQVQVDLDNANPTTGQLQFHAAPEEGIAAVWAPYKARFSMAVGTAFANHFGPEELTDLACNIALGEVGTGDIERLREAAATVRGYDMLPNEAKPIVS